MALVVEDLSNFSQTLQRGWYMDMQLSTMSGSTLALAAACTEEVAGSLILVNGGNEPVTDGGVPDGEAWVYVELTGPTTAVTYLSENAPTFDPSKRGYYIGSAKAVFSVVKKSGVYVERRRLIGSESILVGSHLSVGESLLSGQFGIKDYKADSSYTISDQIYDREVSQNNSFEDGVTWVTGDFPNTWATLFKLRAPYSRGTLRLQYESASFNDAGNRSMEVRVRGDGTTNVFTDSYTHSGPTNWIIRNVDIPLDTEAYSFYSVEVRTLTGGGKFSWFKNFQPTNDRPSFFAPQMFYDINYTNYV